MSARRRSRFEASFVMVALMLNARASRGEEQVPAQLEGVKISEKLGAHLDLSLSFIDHDGKPVKLGDYFSKAGKRPVVLTLNYFRCRMLCSMQLNALVKGLRGLKWIPGEQFRLLTISIDPRDTSVIAKGKRATYLRSLGKATADWTFLLSKPTDVNVKAVANKLGFHYKYVKKEDQYAHPAAIFFLSPNGKVTRYLYGVQYKTRDIRFALVDASEGRVGSTIDKILLSCFHYDASTGRYAPFAFGIMRLGGAATVAVVGVVLAVFWRRERRAKQRAAEENV